MRVVRRAAVATVATIAALAGLAGAASAQDGAQHSLRESLTKENFYFVMADRFENGSKANDLGGLPADRLVSGFDPTARGFYHGGDLRGLIKRLDYIKGLGTTAIWLTPSFKNRAVQLEDGPSAGYHGYWITDFTQIDPHLGTNADLAELVAKAHQRGMKVFFDIITNHTADVIQYEEGARTAYVSKDQSPYLDAAGDPFDDRDFAGGSTFPALDPDTSFPYHPIVPPEMPRKVPEWLNDVTNYHNRGNTTFTGEDSQYGDFFGLDDLFTEKPEVVQGMIDIYEGWIRDFRIDGFRIDTMKHVNDEFWQQFGPEVLRFARANGVPNFFMFGEVADDTLDVPLMSHYTTKNDMQSVLDFGFQQAAERYVARNSTAKALSDFFLTDDWYTDADSNVYQLPTFLGNHDRGRIGLFINQGNPGINDRERLQRDKLGHALMYLSRGMPVVYYGDEQGFTGDGNDQLARQDMFPSQVPEYNDDDLIGNRATTAQSNFVRSTALYTAIAKLARLTSKHPALRDGAHQNRFADEGQGVYAFSRTDRETQREFVVAVNNAEQARDAVVPTFGAGRSTWGKLFGSGPGGERADAQGRLHLRVPALSAVVYRANARIPESGAAPDVSVASAEPSARSNARMEVKADVDGDSFYEVTFQAKVGDGDFEDIGTDDSAPYSVYHEISELQTGTPVAYRAIVLDNSGHTQTSDPLETATPAPRIRVQLPGELARVRNTVSLLAFSDPDRADQSARFERSLDGGETWTVVGTDTSSPAWSMTDDLSDLGLADGAQVVYRVVLVEASGNEVVSETRTVTQVLTPVTTLVIHYFRPDGDYDGWGLHLFGDAIRDDVAASVKWEDPFDPVSPTPDADGLRFEVPIDQDTARGCFIIHQPAGDIVPDTREPGGDQCLVPLEHPEVWMVAGDPVQHYTDPTPD